MFTVSRMSAATVSALALVCLLSFFVIESWPKATISFMDLYEFKELPTEVRTLVRSLLPNSSMLKKQWGNMNQQQKQAVIQQIASQIPGGSIHQPQNTPKAPSTFVKIQKPLPPTPSPVFEVEDENKSKKNKKEASDSEVPEVEDKIPQKGLKSGFLLPKGVNKSQKKAPNNKKEDEVITLSDIGASDAEGGGAASGDDD